MRTSDSPAAKTVTALIKKAIAAGATDIHIEPRENLVVLRYRIDGLLRETGKLPLSTLMSLIDCIKNLSNLALDEQQVPQDGHFDIELDDKSYALHVSILPTLDGEKVVLKIHSQSPEAPTLKELGVWGTAFNDLQHAMVQPHGMIVVTGPVRSGKATTLFSLLSALNVPNSTIATIEDPITYRIIGANQTQVNPSLGISYYSGFQALLRQEPNIIMVGEISELETAQLAAQTASTGHVVLSSMHASNAANCLGHLRNMGVEPFLIARSAQAVIGQRLLRRLCETCREAFTPTKANQKYIQKIFSIKVLGGMARIHKLETSALAEGIGDKGTSSQASSTSHTISRLWKAHKDGCNNCNYSGYKGRVGIYEVLAVSNKLQSMVASDAPSTAIEEAAINQGMVSLQIDALIKALRGETTIEEIVRVLTR